MKLVEDLLKLPREQRQQHLRLSEPCIERGGISTQHRGVLVEYLQTDFPTGYKSQLCHACHNEKCSNPRHLYWGTPKENVQDAIDNGTHTSIYERTVLKRGLEATKKLQATKAEKMNRVLAKEKRQGAPGKPKSAQHRQRISESLKTRA